MNIILKLYFCTWCRETHSVSSKYSKIVLKKHNNSFIDSEKITFLAFQFAFAPNITYIKMMIVSISFWFLVFNF